jgi:hypothetical protein
LCPGEPKRKRGSFLDRDQGSMGALREQWLYDLNRWSEEWTI